MYHSTEYHREFWNAARGRSVTYSHISEGKNTANGSYRLPSESEKKFVAARKQENLLRQIATVMDAIKGENVVWAYDNEPATTWLNQRNNSNFFQNTEVFEEHRLECNILGASILMPEDFCNDANFDVESHILKDFGRNIDRAEEAAFISGDGVDAPHGFMKDAVVGHSTGDITYDDVIRLFFSLDKEYRRILGKTFKPDVLSKRRMKNTGQSPMYYAENTHPAIITQEMFDMAQAEMQRRRDEKITSVGSSRYTSKYPLSGLLVCGTCGHRLRRHVRTVGSGKRVAAWGCTNRISNGRSVCDSHHINEDVLEHTIRAAFDGMEDVLDVVEESCAEVLEADNHTELEQVQQDIIAIQEAVLSLHKAQQQGAVSEMDYEIKIASYSQQMDELQERQRELKATAGRFAEVKYWMDTFKEHVHSGEKMDTTDAVVLRQLTDRIVVYDDRLEIHLRIGGVIECAYTLT